MLGNQAVLLAVVKCICFLGPVLSAWVSQLRRCEKNCQCLVHQSRDFYRIRVQSCLVVLSSAESQRDWFDDSRISEICLTTFDVYRIRSLRIPMLVPNETMPGGPISSIKTLHNQSEAKEFSGLASSPIRASERPFWHVFQRNCCRKIHFYAQKDHVQHDQQGNRV